jgi:hypothetical protein
VFNWHRTGDAHFIADRLAGSISHLLRRNDHASVRQDLASYSLPYDASGRGPLSNVLSREIAVMDSPIRPVYA